MRRPKLQRKRLAPGRPHKTDRALFWHPKVGWHRRQLVECGTGYLGCRSARPAGARGRRVPYLLLPF